MKQFSTILKFELLGYLKNKVFVGITLFLVVAIAVVMFIPNIIGMISSNDTEPDKSELPVMMIMAEDETLASTIEQYFTPSFPGYAVSIYQGSVDELKGAILAKEVDCAFVIDSSSSYTYYVNNLSMYDMNTEIANTLLQEVYRFGAMIDNDIPPQVAGEIMSVEISGKVETLGKDQMQNFFYAYIMIMALYMVILLYGQMVATNVATEKSSRAMEVLITSAKPTSMMFGKVLASCIAGFTQLVSIFGTAILFYNINKEHLSNPLIASIFDIPVDLFAYLIIFFILGFLIYAFMFGAIGSTASKLEDINTSVMPITFLFIIAFMVVVFSISSGSVDNLAMIICSFVPFTSPMAMFARITLTTVPWYEIVVSILILVASVVGVGILSAKIYRVGVLLYGTPPKITTIIKSIIKK